MANSPSRWSQVPGHGSGRRFVRIRKAGRRRVPPATNDNRMPWSVRLMRLIPVFVGGLLTVAVVWAFAV